MKKFLGMLGMHKVVAGIIAITIVGTTSAGILIIQHNSSKNNSVAVATKQKNVSTSTESKVSSTKTEDPKVTDTTPTPDATQVTPSSTAAKPTSTTTTQQTSKPSGTSTNSNNTSTGSSTSTPSNTGVTTPTNTLHDDIITAPTLVSSNWSSKKTVNDLINPSRANENTYNGVQHDNLMCFLYSYTRGMTSDSAVKSTLLGKVTDNCKYRISDVYTKTVSLDNHNSDYTSVTGEFYYKNATEKGLFEQTFSGIKFDLTMTVEDGSQPFDKCEIHSSRLVVVFKPIN